MKKYFISILAAAVAFVSCINFEETLPLAVEKGGQATFEVSEVKDSSFIVTITAPEGTGYYSYAVIAGTKAPSADKIFSVKCATDVQRYDIDEEGQPKIDEDGKFVTVAAEGTVRYDKGSESVTMTCVNLVPATTYSIVVVAASDQGTQGDIAMWQVTTGDNIAPKVKSSDKAEADSTAITLIFDDKIELAGDGTGAVAHFFGINYSDSQGNLKEMGSEPISKDSVSVSGNKLRLAATVKQPGLLTIFTIPAGFVKNTSGLLNAASPAPAAVLKSHGTLSTISDANGYVWAKNKSFDLIPYGEDENGELVSLLVDDEEADNPKTAPKVFADTTYMFGNWEDFMMYVVPENEIAYDDPEIAITYVQSNGRTINYFASNSYYYNYGETGLLGIVLDEAPEYGAAVYYTIAENSYEDVFGNPSNALTILTDKDEDGNYKYVPYFYSYGYKLADICGTYNISGTSAATGGAITETGIIIAPNTEPDEDMPYDLLLYNYGMTCSSNSVLGNLLDLGPIGAWFDPDSGIVTIDEQIFGYSSEYEYLLAIAGNSTEDYSMVWSMPAAGSLVAEDYQLYELYTTDFDYDGYYEVLSPGAKMTRVSADYSVTSAASKSKKVSRGCKVNIGEGMFKF